MCSMAELCSIHAVATQFLRRLISQQAQHPQESIFIMQDPGVMTKEHVIVHRLY